MGPFLPRGKETNVYKNTSGKVSKSLVDVLLKVQLTPALALSFTIIKVNVIRENREHSFSQDNMENFTAFIPS